MYQAAQARMYYCLYNNGTKRQSMPVCTPFEIPRSSPEPEYILETDIQDFLGSAPSPMCLLSVIMESKRTLEVPERSLGGS